MARTLLLAAILLQAQATRPATGTIQGLVRDTGSQGPIARAVVFVTGAGVATDTRTDTDGRFAFPALPAGTYELLAAKPGFTFDGRAAASVTVAAGRTTTLTLEMSREEPRK